MVKKTTTRRTTTATRPMGGIAASMPMPTIPAQAGNYPMAMTFAPPAGLFTDAQALEADVSGELAGLAPTFGDVLLSIGTGVADSQSALDQGLINTATQLSNTKITFVSEVIQELDDDGIPDASKTQLISSDVSLINFVSPTVHEWKHVALSMDLEVAATDYETGVSFRRDQTTEGVHAYGLFWGFLGWFDTDTIKRSTSVTTNTDRETDWARGQVRMDAMLGPRSMDKFPVPADVSIGPQIYFSQGSVTEIKSGDTVTSRSMDMVIKVLKADGSANPSVNIEVDPDRYALSYSTDGDYNGSTTNSQGEIKITLTRNIPNARFLGAMRITAQLGQLSKTIEITL